MQCKNCGTILSEGVRFCTNCGTKQEQAAETPVATPVTTPESVSAPEPTPAPVQIPSDDPFAPQEPVAPVQIPSDDPFAPQEPVAPVSGTPDVTSEPIPAQNPVADVTNSSDPFAPQVPFTPQESFAPTYNQAAPAPEVKKKKKKNKFLPFLIVTLILVFFIAIAGLIGYIFRKNIFFAISPDKYTASLMENTLEKLTAESTAINNNLFGFVYNENDDASMFAEVNYTTDDDNIFLRLDTANKPGDKELIARAEAKINDETKDAIAYLNESEIGLYMPGTSNKYLTVPSKDFGIKLLDSNGFLKDLLEDELDEDVEELLKDLDLSYSSILSPESYISEYEAIEKHSSAAFLSLLKNSEIGKRVSVKYDFENSTVNANEIAITVTSNNLINAYIEFLTNLKNDETLNEKYEKGHFNQIDDSINELKDLMDKNNNVYLFFTLIEYDSRIVEIGLDFAEDLSDSTDEYSFCISFTNEENYYDGIIITYKNVYESDDYESSDIGSIVLKSNWASEDTNIVLDVSYEDVYESDYTAYETSASLNLNLDYDKEVWNLVIKTDDEEESFEGTCSKDDGFSATFGHSYTYTDFIDYYESDYDEWTDEMFDLYSDTYLRDLYYNDDYYFNYIYDSYFEWYLSESYDIWNVNDGDFQEWLEEYLDCDLYDLYEEEEHIYEEVDKNARFDVKFGLNNKTDLEIVNKKTEDILDWDEDDFENLGEKIVEEFEDVIE